MLGKNITAWGRQCKAQMCLLGKTLDDVCTESGFSRSYVSGIINGRLYAPPEALDKISAVLKVDPALYEVAG